jgi:hypothetical protein
MIVAMEAMKGIRNGSQGYPFNIVKYLMQNMNLDGGEANTIILLTLGKDDLHYLKLEIKSMVPLYIGSDLNILTSTLMLLNTCVTH